MPEHTHSSARLQIHHTSMYHSRATGQQLVHTRTPVVSQRPARGLTMGHSWKETVTTRSSFYLWTADLG